MDIAGVDVEIDVIRELPELEDLEVNPSTEDQSFNSSKYGFKNVIIKGIKGEKLELNPSLEQQNVKGVFTEVNINPIQTKKLNATPTTQEQVISGLFDEVTVNAIEGQELNLNPSEEQQNYEGVFLGVNIKPIQVEEITTDLDFSSSNAIELTAQEGAYIKKATINKDANLTPENIKSGVSIAGISGDVADTSDADATSDDIIAGKTAYVGNEKIAGTYIPLDTSDATATAEDIAKDKTAYVNGEKVVGTLEISGGEYNAKVSMVGLTGDAYTLAKTLKVVDFSNVDTSKMKYFSSAFRDFTGLEEVIGLNTSQAIYTQYMFQNCTSLKVPPELVIKSATNISYMYYGCTNLLSLAFSNLEKATDISYLCNGCTKLTSISIPNLPLVTNIRNLCNGCSNLVDVSAFSAPNITNMSYMFTGCSKLSDESLNNILAICISVAGVSSSNRTLKYIGLTSEQATKCQSLSNYQAFLDAGWTTGY